MIPPHRDVCEWEQLWSSMLTKEQEQQEAPIEVFVCVTMLGLMLIAETAFADKQRSLGDVVIITIYPHG